MATKKLNVLWSTLCFTANLTAIFSQNLSITPNPGDFAVCPNINVTYTITGYNADCHSITVSNGFVISDTDNGTLVVNWPDNGFKGSITVTRNPTGCSGALPTITWDVPIRTLVGLTPTITGPTGPAAGFVNTITYTAVLSYPYRGNMDPLPFAVTSFTWTLPVGWTNNSTPPTSATISVTTNIGGGGNVTAIGRTTCGAGASNSLTAVRPVTRTLSTPCPLIAQKTIVRCEEPEPNSFAASSQPAGYAQSTPTWSWSVPTGWTFNGPSNSQFVNVNMDGQHGGNVVATFSDYGISASCPLNVPLVIVNPGTVVDGNEKLCETQDYSLLSGLPQPEGASISWAITTPNAPITPLEGDGEVATISPVIGTSSGPGSEATLAFTIEGCGLTETLEKTFFVGRPNRSTVIPVRAG